MSDELKNEIKEVHQLVNELRDKHKAFEEGKFTPGEFKSFSDKINGRIDQLETIINRPPLFDPRNVDGKVEKEGAKEYKAAFFNFIRTGDLKLEGKAAQYDMERKALVADVTGQILIPEEIETEIYRALPQLNVIRQLASTRTITRDRLRLRSMTEVQVGWGKLELGGAPPETTLVPSETWQYAEDLEGLSKIGKDELMDSDQSLEPILADSFARAMADIEETAFVNGTGHATQQPSGLCLAASAIPTHALTAANAITLDDILDLIYATPAQYRQNGTFVMHSQTELLLRQIRATTFDATHYGVYLWQPSIQAGKPATLAGYPVVACDSMPQLTDGVNQRVVIFGDFKAGYRIIDRLGMTIQRLLELYATAGLVGFLASRRVGGSVVRPDALRILIEP